jgi:hypothetical protein
MKAAFILFFAIVLLKTAYGQGDAPAMLQGQYQTTKSVGATIQIDNSQVTKINSSTALLETTNNNLLINGGFEHQTYNTSWTVGAGTPSAETSVVFRGKKSFKISLSNQTLSVTQDATTYAAQYAGNPKGIAYARVKASSTSVKLCPRQAGTTSSTCSAHSGSGNWELLSVEFSLGATSNGVAIITSSGIGSGGNPALVYIDEVYVGVKSAESVAACPTTLDCVDTFSFSGNGSATVSNENINFVDGNGTVSNTSQFTYTLISGIFSQAPNCVCSSFTTYTLNSQKSCQVVSTSTTSISVFTTANDVNAAHTHNVICQRQGADFIGKSVQVAASDQNIRTQGITDAVFNSCRITNNGTTASVDTASGLCANWISSVSRNSTGSVTITLNSTIFQNNPVCIASLTNNGNRTIHARVDSTTSILVTTWGVSSLAASDENFSISCHGISP